MLSLFLLVKESRLPNICRAPLPPPPQVRNLLGKSVLLGAWAFPLFIKRGVLFCFELVANRLRGVPSFFISLNQPDLPGLVKWRSCWKWALSPGSLCRMVPIPIFCRSVWALSFIIFLEGEESCKSLDSRRHSAILSILTKSSETIVVCKSGSVAVGTCPLEESLFWEQLSESRKDPRCNSGKNIHLRVSWHMLWVQLWASVSPCVQWRSWLENLRVPPALTSCFLELQIKL